MIAMGVLGLAVVFAATRILPLNSGSGELRETTATVLVSGECAADQNDKVMFTVDGEQHVADLEACGHHEERELDVEVMRLGSGQYRVWLAGTSPAGVGETNDRVSAVLLTIAAVGGAGLAFLVRQTTRDIRRMRARRARGATSSSGSPGGAERGRGSALPGPTARTDERPPASAPDGDPAAPGEDSAYREGWGLGSATSAQGPELRSEADGPRGPETSAGRLADHHQAETGTAFFAPVEHEPAPAGPHTGTAFLPLPGAAEPGTGARGQEGTAFFSPVDGANQEGPSPEPPSSTPR
ncbi:hypothetical protein [Actinoalloteichus spitiensis]|uniref:hypothetical protein n=1 Tax=Actinoalloteichus spitiensis TaxID=252394 RepID=UPI0004744A27|nr:hypothetical protein [Actinoalloteichus spitiensis]